MKKLMLTPLVLLSFFTSFAQDLKYELSSKSVNPIKKEKLATAKTMNDIIPGYPDNWITGYVSVEISGTCNGKIVKAKGTDQNLTKEQKALLSSVDLSTNIVVMLTIKPPMLLAMKRS
jgi:hypothetical protein